jgi:hypothetical protein
MTTIDSNNELIKFTQDINREFVRDNLFSAYMGEGLTSIIIATARNGHCWPSPRTNRERGSISSAGCTT